MAITKLRHVGIQINEGVLTMSAYKFVLKGTSLSVDYQWRSEDDFTCNFNKRNHNVIAYILDLEEWDMRGSWEGYSGNTTTEELSIGDTPTRIAKWLKAMKTYELRIGEK